MSARRRAPQLTAGTTRPKIVGARRQPVDPLNLPFRLLLVYFFVEYVRPHDRIGGLGSLKIGLLVTVASFLTWISMGDKGVLRDPLMQTFIIFIVAAATTITFAVNTFWVYQLTLSMFLTLIAGVLPTTTALATSNRLMRFFPYWIGFHVILGVFSLRTGGRGPGAFLGDENDLALAINMSVPYAYFLSQSKTISHSARLCFLIALFVLLLTSVFTWSRGGFLGLLACGGAILLLTKDKVRNLLITISFGIAAVGAIEAFSDKGSVIHEFSTIQDPNDSTRRDRIDSWKLGWAMFTDNPVFGVGVGNYNWRVAEYQLGEKSFDPNSRLRGGRAAHSLYVTLIAELGSIGIILYVSMIWLMVAKCRRIIRAAATLVNDSSQLQDLALIAKAALASLTAFLVSGAFVSVLYYPHFFYLLGFVIAASLAAAQVKQTNAPPPAPRISPSGQRNRSP